MNIIIGIQTKWCKGFPGTNALASSPGHSQILLRDKIWERPGDEASSAPGKPSGAHHAKKAKREHCLVLAEGHPVQ